MSNLPYIPIPIADVNSLITTLSAMRQYILALSGQPEVVRQPYTSPFTRTPAIRGGSPQTQPQYNPTKVEQWTELHRVTENVKIVHPEDDQAWLVQEQTKHLVMHNSVTGEYWTYQRDNLPAKPKGPTGSKKPQSKPKPPTGPTGTTGSTGTGGFIAGVQVDLFYQFGGGGIQGPYIATAGVASNQNNLARGRKINGVWTIPGDTAGGVLTPNTVVGGSLPGGTPDVHIFPPSPPPFTPTMVTIGLTNGQGNFLSGPFTPPDMTMATFVDGITGVVYTYDSISTSPAPFTDGLNTTFSIWLAAPP